MEAENAALKEKVEKLTGMVEAGNKVTYPCKA